MSGLDFNLGPEALPELRYLCHREEWMLVLKSLNAKPKEQLFDELFQGGGEPLYNALTWGADRHVVCKIMKMMDQDPQGRHVCIMNILCTNESFGGYALERLVNMSSKEQKIAEIFYAKADGWTCLHHLAEMLHPNIYLFRELAYMARQDPWGRNVFAKKTQAHCAALGSNDTNIIRLVIRMYPTALGMKDSYGKYPINLAAEGGAKLEKRLDWVNCYNVVEKETWRYHLPKLNQRMVKMCYRSLTRRGILSEDDMYFDELHKSTRFVFKVINHFVVTEHEFIAEHIIEYVGGNQHGLPKILQITEGVGVERRKVVGLGLLLGLATVVSVGLGEPADGLVKPWVGGGVGGVSNLTSSVGSIIMNEL
ncbi:hypothetical protein TrLO_g10813 [Triparma laevis f. longispina]|uniref:Uncharacterized protein n=1 Tax=Triparma laevis f. longispina TaxID=1714387 RepID=A0A9W7FUG5_9STRA|nr:hypothetical protein TrLO_g10813 [Triparma laevis f. longispina]